MHRALLALVLLAAAPVEAQERTRSGDKPDLTITALDSGSSGFSSTYDPQSPETQRSRGFKMGLCNTLRVVVRNTSSVAVRRPFTLRVFLGSKVPAGPGGRGERFREIANETARTIEGLGARRSKTVLIEPWKITETLQHERISIVAHVDSRGQVAERNERNNLREVALESDLLDWERPCARAGKGSSQKRKPAGRR